MTSIDLLFAGPWGPVLIFLLRLVDVSLATIRMLLSIRGKRIAVPIIGFFEVMIWIFAVGSAIRNLNSLWHILGYGAGFATGSALGLWIEEKLAFGVATVRVVSLHGGVKLADALRKRGFGVTQFMGQGREGTVEMVYTVVRRREVDDVLEEVDRHDPKAFVSVEEPRRIRRGWMYSKRRK